jgi:glycosyltransferase involved in cell wall biosynthesis
MEQGGYRETAHSGEPIKGCVSVVTVTFNAAATLARTVDSVRRQTHALVEHLIIDGGSTDGTLSLLRDESTRVAYWISEPDKGISDAFNKGILASRGEFVAILNADDWLEPEHFATAVRLLSESPVDFVFGDLALHGPLGERVHDFVGDAHYANAIDHYMPFLNHPTVVCRRSAFEHVGLFDTELRTAMDYDWFLRAHRMGLAGRYSKDLLAHMQLEGESDRNFRNALIEVRDISIRHGYSPGLARVRYAYRLLKGTLRRRLRSVLPVAFYELLRKSLNPSYRSSATGGGRSG